MENILKKDKKQINLPVPLNSIIYGFNTKCGDFCTFQKEKFNKIFEISPKGRCSIFTYCHTIFQGTYQKQLVWSNLEYVLKYWGILFFETEEEAHAAGINLVNEHVEKMKEWDFI